MSSLQNPTRTLRSGLAAALLLLGVAVPLSAQSATGRIIGRVVDAENAQPLNSAQVSIEGTGIGTLSDLNGRYVLRDVPAGTHTVQVQNLGYGSKSVTEVTVTADQVTSLDISMEQQAVEVEGITVSAAAERGSNAFLLDQRRTSSAMVESVGSTEISRRPDSDAADVAKRMTGVTVADGKYVFVRGLGQRYSQTSLNGSSLPSPEPEKETVPLDLFPSGFLESMETQKSYTPDQPADFSGGAVKIKTKDFPNEFTIKLGLGSSFNTESQFHDGYRSFPNSDTDFIGFDDGLRAIPDEADRILGGIQGNRLPQDPAQAVAVGESLRGAGLIYTPELKTTPLNRSFDLSVGGRADAFDDGELGYFVAGTYSDSYTRRVDERELKWRSNAFDPAQEVRSPNVDYTFDRGTRAITWGTIANFTVKPNPDQKISLRTTVNVNTEDEARQFQGINAEDINGNVRSDRSRFLERLLTWGQLAGEHAFLADSRLEWRLTAGRANRDEPFLREAIYLEDGDVFRLTDEAESGKMFWTELTDDDMSADLDWRVPFELFDEDAAVKVGGSYRSRTRDFGARRFFWDFLGNIYGDIDAALDTATIVAGTARRPGEFGLREIVEPGDYYDAEDDRVAGYAMLEIPLGERLQLIGGARVEQYDLELTTLIQNQDTILADVSETDVAPSLNLIFSATDNVKIRGAVSRTLDRPEFRELAPFQFTEAASLRQIFGNPQLGSATITSGDLRVDWFPRGGEMISIGGFYKQMDDPIEQVFVAAASSAYSYQNADEGRVLGLEVEANLRLDRISETLRDLSAQANYSWLDSEVDVVPGGIYQPTNLTRPLEGQAAYVVNAGLNWTPMSGWEAGVFYNRFGERLEAAGGSGLPDIYQQPRNALDLTLGIPLLRGARAKIKATNILNEPYRWEQAANGVTLLQREYEVGTTISIGLNWELR